MSISEVAPNWERLKNLDIGELNSLNSDVFESRYDDRKDFNTTLNEIFVKHYSYDISEGSGPYAAVVLDILSGPQVKNQGTTGGRIQTTGLNIDEYQDAFLQALASNNQQPPVVVIAKIPEFDVDIDWPKDNDDKARIDAHGEFWQFRLDDSLGKITVGSVVWVAFSPSNNRNKVAIDGKPAGKIIGVHSVASATDIVKRISAKKAMNPKCQAARNIKDPFGNLYVSSTNPNPSDFGYGPPIKRIKGHIKTGMYGNGTAATKEHFEAALRASEPSPGFWYQNGKKGQSLPGPAPTSNNAFIWIGTLKNNGYMDYLDRPFSHGRETIIYAPMTLDLTSPIEIKYYFHDKAGFGHAHVAGPKTDVIKARAAALHPGNDFREKIGPAIKDLNKAGRNYILVIPEMAYSRGYGSTDKSRVSKLASGQSVQLGALEGETFRTKVPSESRGVIKEYLNKLPIETNKNVLHITPLREREFATFDGSFSGGKFGDFAAEVLDVLDEHLGKVSDKIEYRSILADGLGSIALAGMVADISVSTNHNQAKQSLLNFFTGPAVRIDFVTDKSLDSTAFYTNYFAGKSPSATVKDNLYDYVVSAQVFVEFNYITSPSTESNFLFKQLGKENDFRNKAASGNNELKMTVQTPGNINGSYIGLHVGPDKTKTNYAFSFLNDGREDIVMQPAVGEGLFKSDGASDKPGASAVPDHHYALSAKPSYGDLERLNKKQKELKEQIDYFKLILNKASESPFPDSGIDPVCTVPEYSAFCENGTLSTSTDSVFFASYKQHLENLKKHIEIGLLIQAEIQIQKILNNKNLLIKDKNYFEEREFATKKELLDPIGGQYSVSYQKEWENLNASFSRNKFTGEGSYLGEDQGPDFLFMIAARNAAPEAYAKIVKKLKQAIDNFNPESVQKPEECADQPKSVSEVMTPVDVREIKIQSSQVAPGSNCADLEISLPAAFEDLAKMIPYFPKKTDFEYSGRISKTKTKISALEGYKTATFKYPARTANCEITHKDSPPMWACIVERIQKAWKEACEESKYYPIEITVGIRGSEEPKTTGTTAYKNKGVSLHSYGLAFDLDPYITGYARNRKALASVYTGAWTPGFIEKHGEKLHSLGVFKEKPHILYNNAYEGVNQPRQTQNWQSAPSHYRGKGESGDAKEKYTKIMNSVKNCPIVPPGANPTLWLILFCEKSGMRWGNGQFLKKRHRGGSKWNNYQQSQISEIFGINDIVNRIQAISWKDNSIDDHMHFHFWGGKSLISFRDIKKEADKQDA